MWKVDSLLASYPPQFMCIFGIAYLPYTFTSRSRSKPKIYFVGMTEVHPSLCLPTQSLCNTGFWLRILWDGCVRIIQKVQKYFCGTRFRIHGGSHRTGEETGLHSGTAATHAYSSTRCILVWQCWLRWVCFSAGRTSFSWSWSRSCPVNFSSFWPITVVDCSQVRRYSWTCFTSQQRGLFRTGAECTFMQ